MIDEVIADAVERMDKAHESLRTDLRSVRTGRASPAILRTCYGRLLWHAHTAATGGNCERTRSRKS